MSYSEIVNEFDRFRSISRHRMQWLRQDRQGWSYVGDNHYSSSNVTSAFINQFLKEMIFYIILLLLTGYLGGGSLTGQVAWYWGLPVAGISAFLLVVVFKSSVAEKRDKWRRTKFMHHRQNFVLSMPRERYLPGERLELTFQQNLTEGHYLEQDSKIYIRLVCMEYSQYGVGSMSRTDEAMLWSSDIQSYAIRKGASAIKLNMQLEIPPDAFISKNTRGGAAFDSHQIVWMLQLREEVEGLEDSEMPEIEPLDWAEKEEMPPGIKATYNLTVPIEVVARAKVPKQIMQVGAQPIIQNVAESPLEAEKKQPPVWERPIFAQPRAARKNSAKVSGKNKFQFRMTQERFANLQQELGEHAKGWLWSENNYRYEIRRGSGCGCFNLSFVSYLILMVAMFAIFVSPETFNEYNYIWIIVILSGGYGLVSTLWTSKSSADFIFYNIFQPAQVLLSHRVAQPDSHISVHFQQKLKKRKRHKDVTASTSISAYLCYVEISESLELQGNTSDVEILWQSASQDYTFAKREAPLQFQANLYIPSDAPLSTEVVEHALRRRQRVWLLYIYRIAGTSEDNLLIPLHIQAKQSSHS